MAEVEKHITEVKGVGKRLTPNMGFFDAKLSGIYDVMSIIDSLQQKQSEEPIPNDLEEAAMNYIAPIENEDGLKVINFSGQDIKDAFIAGAKFDRQQMMKEAVEKTVGQLERQWGGNIHFMHGFEVDEMDFPFLNSQECGYGDKVRIIIVKEDGK